MSEWYGDDASGDGALWYTAQTLDDVLTEDWFGYPGGGGQAGDFERTTGPGGGGGGGS